MAYWVLKVLLSPVFLALFRVRVEGRSQVPLRGPAILAANHQSFCDSFFLPLVLRRKVTFLAKAEYFDSPRTAWFFRAAGQIPIRRQDSGEAASALSTALGVLSAGRLLALYPEGTRSPDPRVHRGRTGVARLAQQSGAPVVPVGISGTSAIQPRGSMVMRPFHTVTLRFGSPLTLEPPADPGGEAAALRSFTDELMAEIARLSGLPYVDRYIQRSLPGAPRASQPSPSSPLS